MKLLVTGGAGFIGSHYVRHALAQGHEVTNLDVLTYAGTLTNLTDVESHAGYRFVRGDIGDPKLVREVMPGHDAVLNFAAESHVDRSIARPADFLQTNFIGAGVLLDAAREAGIGRFIQISTDEVYGPIEAGSFRETDRLRPSSPYAAAKAGADLLARSFLVTYGLPVVITRSANAFGPNQFPEKFIPLAVTNIIDGRPAPLYGDGLHIRDWTHVLDVVAGIHAVLERGEIGGIYNIAAGNERRNRDVLEQIVVMLGGSSDLIAPVADRPGHDRRYSIDATRIQALGWTPAQTFDEALRDTVQWYRDNRAWWEPLKERT